MKSPSVVVHLTEVKPSTTIASARIAKFVKNVLNVDLFVDNLLDIKVFLDEFKTFGRVYLVNGPPAFCQFREELAQMVRRCEDLVFIQNDYTIYPPSQVNKVMRERGWIGEKGEVDPPARWTTIPARLKKLEDSYINWNALTFDPARRVPTNRLNKLFYYGAFRDGRVESFMRFFPEIQEKLVISGSGRAEKKFRSHFDKAGYLDPQEDIIKACSAFAYGLYIEDKSSHRTYMSLANRFYEMLSAKMLIYVDDEAIPTFTQAGYMVPDEAVVTDGDELRRAMRRKKVNARLQRWQHKHWRPIALRQHTDLPYEIRRAQKHLENST